MEYFKEKLRLQLRIEVIQELQVPLKYMKIRDDLVDTLNKVLYLSESMESSKNCKYLQGINKALGGEKEIAKWMLNNEFLAKTCKNLHQFIEENYKKSDIPANVIRLNALMGLMANALALIVILASIAIISFYAILAMSLPPLVVPVLFFGIAGLTGLTIFAEEISSSIHSKLGLDKSDSLWSLFFHGVYAKDRVNYSLLTNCSLFASAQTKQIPVSLTDFNIDLQPIFEKTHVVNSGC